MSKLNINFFFGSPVQAVTVTAKNLQQIAEWCGGRVAQTESRKVPGRMDSYVWVPTPEGSKISWAFPGMVITRRLAVAENNELKMTYSVFRRDYFAKNFFEDPAVALDMTWSREEKERKHRAKQARTLTIELPEGADVEAAKAKILQEYVKNGNGPDLIDDDMIADFKTTEETIPDSMVDQRSEARAEIVEEEALPNVPKAIGNALTPFEAGDPSRT